MFYTGKGDKGTTKLFKTNVGERLSKSSDVFEALGTLDELNSFLGFCKVKLEKENFKIKRDNINLSELINIVQNNLFIIQAELAGSEMRITIEKIKEIENIINLIENELPEIKTFFVPGGTEIGSFLDISRAISRRAERKIIRISKKEKVLITKNTKAYINRLSSFLYALARLVNYQSGIPEQPPNYK